MGKRQRFSYKDSELPQPKVLVNPSDIPKHSMLMALEDKIVKAAVELDKEARLKALAQKNKDQ